MKKIIFALAILSVLSLLQASEINLRSKFQGSGPGVLPGGWQQKKWNGYKPYAKYEMLKEKDLVFLHVHDIKSPYGASYSSQHIFNAKAGDKVTFTAKVKGDGAGIVNLDVYSASKWIGIAAKKYFELTPEWTTVKIVIPVKDLKDQPTARAVLSFGANCNSELFITDIKAFLNEK